MTAAKASIWAMPCRELKMQRDLLTDCGEALFGSRWQSALARALDVDDRTMRRWVSGENGMPAGVNIDLLRLLTERASDIGALLPRLKKA